MPRLKLVFPYLLFAALAVVIACGRRSAPAGGDRLVDVVCHMEVSAAWDIRATYGGETYYFCTRQCRDAFTQDPPAYLAARCLVCRKPLDHAPTVPATYHGKTYRLCSQAHRTEFQRDPAAYFMHSMWGIPSWLYYLSIALVLLVSFGVFDLLGKRTNRPDDQAQPPSANPSRDRLPLMSRSDVQGKGADVRQGPWRRIAHGNPARGGGAVAMHLPAPAGVRWTLTHLDTHQAGRADRFDLLSIGIVSRAFRSRPFRFGLQAVVVALFLLIIAAGLFGNQNPGLNIAPILTWTVWWGLLIVLILFAGKAWCYVCPWDAVAGWTEKLALWKKRDEGLSLNLRWPRAVRNVLIATVLFVGLTWIELGFGVTMKPRVTAYLALAMLMLAVASALLFEKKSFCRYACLVGRVSGLYALFAGTEVRVRKPRTCQACSTKECVTGSATAYGCPTFLYPGKLATNTYCIQCLECVQACPHDNLALHLRPWGSDLAREGKPRSDEAHLALLMLAITGFHGLTMTPAWAQLVNGLRRATGTGPMLGFSLGMALLMLAPVAVYAALVALSKRCGDTDAGSRLTYRDYFVRYAYALLPIALFYHIAHNCEHLLMEGPKVLAMISDPFGWGWDLFGTGRWTIPPLISLERLWLVQVLLVLIGHVYSLWVAQRTALRLFGTSRAAFRSQLPMLAGMICFSVFSLWLLKQPMEMRTSAM